MRMSSGSVVALLAAAAVTSSAAAQPLVPTSQTRAVTVYSTSTDPGGSTVEYGPIVHDAPAGYYGDFTCLGELTLPVSFIGGTQVQTSGWDGANTIQVQTFAMNLGGGGAPGASALSTATNEFSMTFDVAEAVTFQLDAQTSCAGPSFIPGTVVDFSIVLRLTSADNTVIFEAQTADPDYSINVSETGQLAPGSYTLSLIGLGEVSWTAPIDSGIGAGGGVGGPSPSLTFSVTPAGGGCDVDLNDSGGADVPDIFAFLSLWFAEDATADWNGSNGVDVPDIFAFLSAWFSGC